jgi:hypothetical protein
MNKSIIDRKNEIDAMKRAYETEAMATYNKTIYYPARKQLVEDCREIGHVEGKWHNNGLGWSFCYCCNCGAVMRKVSDEEDLREGVDF